MSRALHRLQSLASTTAASLVAASLSALILAWAIDSGSRARILLWFEGVASAVTVVMVFVLQHTQTRHELALQRKLDEILRAIPTADNRLINLEGAPEEDLEAHTRRYAAIKEED
jgi:low affinity Fe/Cu permease